ncbi:hypothetical protein G7K_5401-t1 [Saitoella complicata NRRL Y-17804]|uniref:Uncharacterized protein n=1 Tax=Saitoella complicata (strain BCRC 22490 / CBS 7301 / JCM 7358 / NBRC 10748 / NRRL Y-17804) TaxID=698492 RepID=A0A0E9NNL7_SAICN|nr:hypothetical protein G7K_5401-t1 [Saitoella complicata NRRL Y-17804]
MGGKRSYRTSKYHAWKKSSISGPLADSRLEAHFRDRGLGLVDLPTIPQSPDTSTGVFSDVPFSPTDSVAPIVRDSEKDRVTVEMDVVEGSEEGEEEEVVPPSPTTSESSTRQLPPPPFKAIFYFTDRSDMIPLLCAVVTATLNGVLMPVMTILLGRIFNGFSLFSIGLIDTSELTSETNKYVTGFTVLGVISLFFGWLFMAAWQAFGEAQAFRARMKLFEGLVGKNMMWYDLREEGVGGLTTRCQKLVEDLQTSTSFPLGSIIQSLVTCVLSLAVAFWHSWSLTLVILASIPFVIVVITVFTPRLQKHIEEEKGYLSNASSIVSRAVAAITTVKAFNGQKGETDKFSGVIASAARSYRALCNVSAFQHGVIRFIVLAMFVQGFWFGSYLVRKGKFSSGDVMTVFWSCLTACNTLQNISPQMVVLEKGKAAGDELRRLMETLDEEGRRIQPLQGGVQLDTVHGDIEFKHVSFAYPSRPDQLVLDDVSVFFPSGETTYVVGSSGSGKSTLTALLLRLYDPAAGNIHIDDNAIQTLKSSWLYTNISVVQQQNVLFRESIFKNIAFGKGGSGFMHVTLDQVKEAVQMALLQETVANLPDGLDTLIDEGSLSGGQKQRVAIARAYVRDAPVLILDEATSALDYISRGLVNEAIRKWRKNKTTIVITHDISQIKEDDFAYVLKGGKLVQEGYRHELMEDEHGHFYSLAQGRGDNDKETEDADDWSQKTMTRAGRPGSRMGMSTSKSEPNVAHRLSSLVTRPGMTTSRSQPQLAPHAIASAFVGGSRLSVLPTSWIQSSMKTSESQASTKALNRLSMTPRPLTMLGGSQMGSMNNISEVVNDCVTASADLLNLGTNTGRLRGEEMRETRLRNSVNSGILLDQHDKHTITEKFVEAKRSKTKSKSIVSIFITAWPSVKEKVGLVGGFVACVVNGFATPIFSFCLAKLLATFISSAGDSSQSTKWSLAVLGISLVDGLSTYAKVYLLESAAQSWVDTARVDALVSVLAQDKSWFDDKSPGTYNSAATISQYIINDAEEMRNIVGRFAGAYIIAGAMVLLGVVWSFATGWQLTAVGVSLAPAMYLATTLYTWITDKCEGRCKEASTSAGGALHESVFKLQTIRVLGLEAYFKNRYDRSVDAARMAGMRKSLYTGMGYGLLEGMEHLTKALMFWYSGVLIAKHTYSVTTMLTVVTLILFSFTTASQTIGMVPQISKSKEGAKNVHNLVNLPRTSQEGVGEVRFPLRGTIKFDNVSFAYPSGDTTSPTKPQLALRNVSFDIAPQETVAIVGLSGSGKSTIIGLLQRLYRLPDMESWGKASIDGSCIGSLNTVWLRSKMAIVSQTPMLFDATIAENIAYGPDTYDQTDIERAARAACIHDFIISLPEGYATRLGADGGNLSGGQKQRIAIARALVRDPRILILDECTSALDSESAYLVMQAISSFVKSASRTTVIVTHKEDMMRMADKIIVMKNGDLVESGTFVELVRRKGELYGLLKANHGG